MKANRIAMILIAAGSSHPLYSATYVSNFHDLAAGATLENLDGWQQSAPNYGPEYPRAFGTEIGSSAAAAVGGYYDTEPPDGEGYFNAFHSLNLALDKPASFYVNFALVDSEGWEDNGVTYGAERNPFQITLRNAANAELFSLIFDPVAGESPDPTASSMDVWNVFWSSGGVKSLPIAAVYEAALYGLNLQFNPNGSNVDFSLGITGTNTFSFSETLDGLADEQITRIEFGIHAVDSTATGTPQFGTNHIAFEGISAIPEPSVATLSVGALLALGLRRRRSAAC